LQLVEDAVVRTIDRIHQFAGRVRVLQLRESLELYPMMTRAKEVMRSVPSQPSGSGSWKMVRPAMIGRAFANRVAMPAVTRAFPRWKPAWSTAVPSP
jgi:hypothetical protein